MVDIDSEINRMLAECVASREDFSPVTPYNYCFMLQIGGLLSESERDVTANTMWEIVKAADEFGRYKLTRATFPHIRVELKTNT